MTDDLAKRLRDGGDTCGIERCRIRDAASGCLCAIAADRIEALEAANLKQSLITVDHLSRIEALEAALRLIAQNDYGLQSMMEDGTDTAENKAEYYAGQVERRRYIARAALAGEKKDE